MSCCAFQVMLISEGCAPIRLSTSTSARGIASLDLSCLFERVIRKVEMAHHEPWHKPMK